MAVELNQVYKCSVCGNIVEVVHASVGELVCCGMPMRLQKENTIDASKEKHVPVIETTPTGVKVRVGSVPHPMEKEHYIEWIELVSDGRAFRQYLKPGQKAEAEFCVQGAQITVRQYCNLHGHWKA